MRAAALAFLALLSTASASSLKTLTVCDDVQAPPTLDPQREFSEKNHTVVQQIYEGLVRFDSSGRIEPALALSWSRLDPTRMRFKLRPRVFYHDGEPFDAEAVRFSIARYLDPATGFPARGFLGPLLRAEVIDPLTVDVVTAIPDGLLLNRLAAFVLMTPPRYLEEKGPDALEAAPVGTGAFRFESRSPGRIVLARNPRYWDPARPKVDQLVFRFIPYERQLAAIESGDVDLLTELPGSQTQHALDSGLVKILKAPVFSAVGAGLNTRRKELADQRVRLALNYAVDREELLHYDARGNGRPLPTMTMDGEEGHAADLAAYPHDLAKARSLLKAAGYPSGFSLTAMTVSQSQRAARIAVRQLARLGVRVTLRVVADAELKEAFRKPEWDMTFTQCPDPMAHSFFIQSILLYSKSPYCVAPDAEYDRLLEGAASLLDARSRALAFQALDHYVHDHSLLLPLYQRTRTYGMREGVSFAPSITGMPYFFDADVAEGVAGR